MEETILSLAKDSMAERWYSENLPFSSSVRSVRAGMEPLTVLKAIWPSLEERALSQFLAPPGCLAPSGRVKESARKSKTPSVPGTGK